MTHKREQRPTRSTQLSLRLCPELHVRLSREAEHELIAALAALLRAAVVHDACAERDLTNGDRK